MVITDQRVPESSLLGTGRPQFPPLPAFNACPHPLSEHPSPYCCIDGGCEGIWFLMCLLLDSYAEGSPTLQRLPGERGGHRVTVRGLLCTNTHTHTQRQPCWSVSTCTPLTLPYPATHRGAHTQMGSQGSRCTQQDEPFQTLAAAERTVK